MKQNLKLIENKIVVANEPCRWCDSLNAPHSKACPLGERYAQVQALGGIRISAEDAARELGTRGYLSAVLHTAVADVIEDVFTIRLQERLAAKRAK